MMATVEYQAPLKDFLQVLYAEFNPDKASNIPEIINQFAGEEQALLIALRNKYDLDTAKIKELDQRAIMKSATVNPPPPLEIRSSASKEGSNFFSNKSTPSPTPLPPPFTNHPTPVILPPPITEPPPIIDSASKTDQDPVHLPPPSSNIDPIPISQNPPTISQNPPTLPTNPPTPINLPLTISPPAPQPSSSSSPSIASTGQFQSTESREREEFVKALPTSNPSLSHKRDSSFSPHNPLLTQLSSIDPLHAGDTPSHQRRRSKVLMASDEESIIQSILSSPPPPPNPRRGKTKQKENGDMVSVDSHSFLASSASKNYDDDDTSSQSKGKKKRRRKRKRRRKKQTNNIKPDNKINKQNYNQSVDRDTISQLTSTTSTISDTKKRKKMEEKQKMENELSTVKKELEIAKRDRKEVVRLLELLHTDPTKVSVLLHSYLGGEFQEPPQSDDEDEPSYIGFNSKNHISPPQDSIHNSSLDDSVVSYFGQSPIHPSITPNLPQTPPSSSNHSQENGSLITNQSSSSKSRKHKKKKRNKRSKSAPHSSIIHQRRLNSLQEEEEGSVNRKNAGQRSRPQSSSSSSSPTPQSSIKYQPSPEMVRRRRKEQRDERERREVESLNSREILLNLEQTSMSTLPSFMKRSISNNNNQIQRMRSREGERKTKYEIKQEYFEKKRRERGMRSGGKKKSSRSSSTPHPSSYLHTHRRRGEAPPPTSDHRNRRRGRSQERSFDDSIDGKIREFRRSRDEDQSNFVNESKHTHHSSINGTKENMRRSINNSSSSKRSSSAPIARPKVIKYNEEDLERNYERMRRWMRSSKNHSIVSPFDYIIIEFDEFVYYIIIFLFVDCEGRS